MLAQNVLGVTHIWLAEPALLHSLLGSGIAGRTALGRGRAWSVAATRRLRSARNLGSRHGKRVCCIELRICRGDCALGRKSLLVGELRPHRASVRWCCGRGALRDARKWVGKSRNSSIVVRIVVSSACTRRSINVRQTMRDRCATPVVVAWWLWLWLSRGACSRWCLESRGDVRRLVVARALALAGRERRTWGSLTLFLVTSYSG